MGEDLVAAFKAALELVNAVEMRYGKISFNVVDGQVRDLNVERKLRQSDPPPSANGPN